MSNISQDIMAQSESLSYSLSSNQEGLNYERLSDSLQYLDRIRKVNQKIFNAREIDGENIPTDVASSTQQKMLALERLVGLNKQITYIDNDKQYGIIRVQKYEKLQSSLQQIQQQLQQLTQSEQNLKTQNSYLKQQLQNLINCQTELKTNLGLVQQSFDAQKTLRTKLQQQIFVLSQSLTTLTNQRVNDSKQYLSLQNDFQTYKYTQQPLAKPSTYKMITQTQTESLSMTITIPPFQPNIEEILKELKSKQGQQVSSANLKEIVQQSLDAFVKQLESQYELIQKQTIDLTQLQQSNTQLLQQNTTLKQKLEEISIEQSKLAIFKTCMTQFLQETTENVTNTIESDRTKDKINFQTMEKQQQQLNMNNPEQELNEQKQKEDAIQLRKLKQNIEHYKKENIKLIKTIGEYQYKWRNVEKVLEENKKQQIPDDGTVGHLVKMSKLVKQSIKNLLHQL